LDGYFIGFWEIDGQIYQIIDHFVEKCCEISASSSITTPKIPAAALVRNE
jgi:hypothetical protein